MRAAEYLPDLSHDRANRHQTSIRDTTAAPGHKICATGARLQRHSLGLPEAGRAPQAEAGLAGRRLRRGDLVRALRGVRRIEHVGSTSPGRSGQHRIVPAGSLDVGQRAVNCSWMIHVVRLCRLNLSAGAFSLHAD